MEPRLANSIILLRKVCRVNKDKQILRKKLAKMKQLCYLNSAQIMKQHKQPDANSKKHQRQLTLAAKSQFSQQKQYQQPDQYEQLTLLQHLQQQLAYYKQKCTMYQQITEQQQHMIASLREQAKNNRDQLHSFKLAMKGKIQGSLKVKNMQILSLQEQINNKNKEIQELQAKIKVRNNKSGIVIEYKDIQNEQYIADLEQLLCEQQKLLTASKQRIKHLQQQLEQFAAIAIDQQGKIKDVLQQLQRVKLQNLKIQEQKCMEINRNKKLKKLIKKSESKIQQFGALLVSIANEGETIEEQKYRTNHAEQQQG